MKISKEKIYILTVTNCTKIKKKKEINMKNGQVYQEAKLS